MNPPQPRIINVAIPNRCMKEVRGMSKKHKRAKRKAAKAQKAASNVVWHQSAEEATLVKKPRYNGFACGHGAHGSAKYDRNKQKREWRKQLDRSQYARHESTRYDKKGASRGPYFLCSFKEKSVQMQFGLELDNAIVCSSNSVWWVNYGAKC